MRNELEFSYDIVVILKKKHVDEEEIKKIVKN